MIGTVDKTPVLTIKLQDKNNPEYKFDGEWNGHAIRTAARHMFRAYRRMTLTQRREAFKASELNAPIGGPATSDLELTSAKGM